MVVVGARTWRLVLALTVIAACGSDTATPPDQLAQEPTAEAPSATSVDTTETSTPSPAAAVTDPEPAPTEPAPTEPDAEMTNATPTPRPEPEPEPACVRLTDFAVEAENASWFIVNDNVMGGQSSGGPTFADSAMLFEGEINTNGGGFSSVRAALGTNVLVGFTELAVHARTDGRGYKLIFEDGFENRDQRVSQQGSLQFADTTDWQTVRVSFADLEPRIFGRAVAADPFRPDLATQLGIMISDGIDGPFVLEIDWIDACP